MPSILTATAACALALSTMLGAIAPAHAQDVVKQQFGDWQIRCDTPPGAKEQSCALVQSVTAANRPEVGLSVIVLKTADGKNRLIRVLAPLGVLLPAALGLRIDGEPAGHVQYVRCLPNGCIAEAVLEDDLLKKLSTGKTATFVIFQTPEQGIGIPVTLKGFADGFAALK